MRIVFGATRYFKTSFIQSPLILQAALSPAFKHPLTKRLPEGSQLSPGGLGYPITCTQIKENFYAKTPANCIMKTADAYFVY
jgi:hypothetical protein